MSDELLSEVLALPPAQRAELAHRLLKSLEPGAEPGVEEAWLLELERRARELDEGRVSVVPWADAKESILAELKKRRAGRASS